MKSLCVKTNNSQVIDYLLKKFEKINLDDTYISIKRFKHYNNIIIHYLGTQYTNFYSYISNAISKAIIEFYEDSIITNSINLNYFYFNTYEKKKIFENTKTLLIDSKINIPKYDYINNEVFTQIKLNHSFYLQPFINFKLNNYTSFLNNQIDTAVNKFLIDKEYIEFVNILKLYIKSESENSKTQHLHLIYKNKTSIIIDDNKNIVSCNDNISKAKYISDISFSSNDLALNTLLNLVPQKITLHLIDGYCDEFINTLKLIFQEKIKICEECDICILYKEDDTKNLHNKLDTNSKELQ